MPVRWVLAAAGVALCAALGAGSFDSSEIGGIMSEIVAYGTAVVLEEENAA